ncbi:MAG: hypothetical protein RXP86_10420 [Acidilobus sp.]
MTCRVADVLVGDGTESIVMTLWDRTSSTFKGMTTSGGDEPLDGRALITSRGRSSFEG